MLRFTLAVVGLFGLYPTPGLAAESSASATVLEHQVDIAIDGALRRIDTVTWTVRIDDPEACQAGLVAPRELDGASDGGAQVLEDVLLIPPATAPGTVFTLKQRTDHGKGRHSGVFLTAPELPVTEARVAVSAPSWVPLHVWSDAGGHPEVDRRRGQRVTVGWDAIEAGGEGQLVWSTWPDWMDAGAAVSEHVDARIATKNQLGRRLAADATSLGVGESIDRVYADIQSEEGNFGSWMTAAPATETLEAGSGSAADRGLVLLSVLRLSGLDAVPATARIASSRGAFPVMVPAPAMLERPVIAVRREEGITWIDPSNDLAAPGDLPAALIGGSAWIPGDLPVDIQTSTVFDGNVVINANLTIRSDGSTSWTASIGASGTAAEALRSLLGGVDEENQESALRKLARQARPDLERFSLSTSGLGRTARPVKLSLSGHDASAVQPLGAGLTGSIAPVIAPALAGWLPPNIRVRESMAISAPPGLQILATSTEPSIVGELALVARDHTQEAQRVNLTIEVERPYTDTTAKREADAAAFLAEQAPRGARLLLFPPATGRVAASIRTSDRPAAERAAIEALLWWRARNRRKPLAVIRKLEDTEIASLIAALQTWADRDDPRPWTDLATIALDTWGPSNTLNIASAMEQLGLRRDAWLLAAELAEHPDPGIRLEALLMMEALQPLSAPSAQEDTRGAQAWRDRAALLDAAEAVTETLGAGLEPRLALRRAEIALEEGRPADAEVLLEQVLADATEGIPPDTLAVATLLLARATAQSGVSGAEVMTRVQQAVARAPLDAKVASMAARTSALLGEPELALAYATTAARLAFDDPDLWSQIVDYAIANGDLPAALEAARRASDLSPEDEALAEALALMGTLVHDRDAAELGRARTDRFTLPEQWPVPLQELLPLAPEDALLGLLTYHDTEVVADAGLLSIRAQMRVDRDDLDNAARDGILLATRHDKPEGHALSFAATAGRLYASNIVRQLDRVAERDPTAQITRMEYRLITAVGDALAAARQLGDDPRAQAIVALRTQREPDLAGWPEGLSDPRVATPRGYRQNRTLGAAAGVVAWSDPDGATAILRTSQVTGLLPPPLNQMYTASERPVKTLENGAQVLRLEGGVIPLYAATLVQDEAEIIGLGFTIESASRAMDAALQ